MLIKPALFLSSYAPLFLLLAIRFENWRLQTAFGILTVLGAAGILVILKINSAASPGPHTFVSVKEAGPEAASYLATYLLPFVTDSAPTGTELILYAIFFGIAATVHFNSSVIQINPLLYMLGIRVLSVVDTGGFDGYLLARGQVDRNDRINCTPLSRDVLVIQPILKT